MLGLIIFGTRGVTSDHAHGEFFCPRCTARQGYVHKRCRRFFTLYFIPLIPLNLVGEYIECQRCAGTYTLEVLQLDPEADAKRHQAEFHKAIRRVLVLISLADGRVDESELAAIGRVLGRFAGREVPRAEIEAELVEARASNGDVVAYCSGMKGYLNDNGRELVVRSAILVAVADGHFDDRERELVARIASALEVPSARLVALIAEATPSAAPAGPPASPPN
jgi:tellurite resistance protein